MHLTAGFGSPENAAIAAVVLFVGVSLLRVRRRRAKKIVRRSVLGVDCDIAVASDKEDAVDCISFALGSDWESVGPKPLSSFPF